MTENIAMIWVTETRRCTLGAALGVLAAVSCAATPAAAQDETKAAATSAFDQAEQLKTAGKLAEACLKYGESERLDPQLGTLLHLADCLEQNGQTASAWAAFREAQEVAEKRTDARQALAEDRVAKLAPHLSKLQINVPRSVEQSTLHVERDHVVVGSALWGAPVPTDSGTHTITVSAPGHHLWTGTAIVRSDGSTSTVDVPELEVEVPSSPESSATPKGSVALVSSATPPPGTDNGGSAAMPTQTVLGISAIGAGVVGLVIGTVFEAQRSSKLSSRDAICPSGNNCPIGSQAQIDNLSSQARSASTAGAVGLVAGGVLAATGVVLILTTPHHSPQVSLAPLLAPRFQGLMLRGNIF